MLHMQLDTEQLHTIPCSMRYQAVRLFHKAPRADEEEFRILSEMRNTVQHYIICMLEVLTTAISDLEQNDEAVSATPYENLVGDYEI